MIDGNAVNSRNETPVDHSSKQVPRLALYQSITNFIRFLFTSFTESIQPARLFPRGLDRLQTLRQHLPPIHHQRLPRNPPRLLARKPGRSIPDILRFPQ